MTKDLVLYYSMYGHIETMVEAVAEGALCVEGTEVAIKRCAGSGAGRCGSQGRSQARSASADRDGGRIIE